MDENESNAVTIPTRPYGTNEKDSETIPESRFKPGAKVLVKNPKTNHWD